MALDISDIRVEIAGRALVDGVSFSLSPGGVTVLLGPNGAGKSTRLKAVCGLIAHSGSVAWNGAILRPDDRRQRARTLAYVPQAAIAHWPIAARTAVAIGRMARGATLSRLSPEDEAAVERALKAVDGTAFADQPITTLSGGERARILMARALAVEAPVMLLDEPIAALDPRHQLAIADLLRRLAGEGRAILAVVHDLSLASRIAARVAVLDKGRLKGLGPPREVLIDRLLADVFGIAARWIDGDGQPLLIADRIART